MHERESGSGGRASRAPGRWLAAALVVALAARVAYFFDLADGPGRALHRAEQSDMAFFDEWADVIAGGDWLTDRVLHPYHTWHARIAAHAFHDDPALGREMELAAADEPYSESAGHALWNRWYGGKQFHQAPLYPYLVALTRVATGSEVLVVLGLQLALGVVSIALLFAVTRRALGVRTAGLAAVLAALYAPFLHYEGSFLRAGPILFLSLWFSYLLGRALDRGGNRRWFLLGLIGGLGALLKPTLVLFPAGAAAAWVLVRVRAPRGRDEAATRRWAEPLGLVLGGLLALAPLVGRNLAVGVAPFKASSVGAVTFVRANAAFSNPETPGVIDSGKEASLLVPSSARFGPTVEATLATHGGWVAFARHIARKLPVLAHWHEKPNNTNFYLSRAGSRVLRSLPLTFVWIFPLALAGLVLGARWWARDLPFLILLVATAVPLLAFHALGRYRCVLVPSLLALAAWMLLRVVDWIRERRWAPVATLALGCALLTWASDRPLHPYYRYLVRPADVRNAFACYYAPEIDRLEVQGDHDAIAGRLAEFARYLPASLDELGPDHPAQDEIQAELVEVAAQVHEHRLHALRRAGRSEEANEERRTVRRLRAAIPAPDAGTDLQGL